MLAEGPQGAGLEAPRPAFGLRAVLILTIAILIVAGILVFVLYGSPITA